MGGETPVELPDLFDAVKVCADVLATAGIRFAVCGGLAAYVRGGMPSDHDVDLLVHPDDADAALTALAAAGLRTERPPEGWLLKAYHREVLVDLIFEPVGRTVTEAVLADTDLLPVGPVRLPVLSATELLIHSLGRLTDQACDLSVPLRLVRAIREQIDADRVRDETKSSPYARAFLSLAADLELLPGGNS